MSSGSLQATSTPYLPPVPHTVSVPQGMLWMRGSWNNMEALTAVSLLWRASHQRQTSRWKNLGGFYDIRLWGGSDMMPHRGTGGGFWETWVSVYVLCQTPLPKCSWSTFAVCSVFDDAHMWSADIQSLFYSKVQPFTNSPGCSVDHVKRALILRDNKSKAIDY